MGAAPTFVTDLALVTGVAAVTGMAAHALGQPRILGYLFAGMLVGPFLPLPWTANPERVHALAEFGVVLVMFAVGLEFRVRRLMQILPVSGFTGLVQVGFLLWAGYSVGRLLGWGEVGAAFLGSALAISSTMVVTGIFAGLKLDRDVREHVLGVLVFQDVAAIALIAAMTALAAGVELAPLAVLGMIAQLGGVLVGLLAVGVWLVPPVVRYAVRARSREGVAVLAVGLAFVAALLAETVGYSAALGAFVAGMWVAESGLGEEVEKIVEPLRAVFAAVFFVSVGMAVDLALVWAHLPTALLVSAVVVAAQLASVTFAGVLSGLPLRRAAIAGLALGQIGEFSFILATIGAAVAPEALLPVLVTTSVITVFSTGWLLRRGGALVAALDHLIPAPVQHLLAMHQSWVVRLRGGGAALRRPLLALLADEVGLLLIAAVFVGFRGPLHHLLQGELGLSATLSTAALNLGVLLLASPLIVGLLRTGRAVAAAAAAVISGGAETPVARVVQALAHLVMVVGVGLPTLALLRPLMGGPWGEPLLAAALGAAVFAVWRNLGKLETEVRSGAERLAQVLAQPGGEAPSLFPGMEEAHRVRISVTSFALGKTLTELNLRARTGATVLVIHRADDERLLPTGHERLEGGDALALVGDDEAIARARALLRDGILEVEAPPPPLVSYLGGRASPVKGGPL